MDDSFEPVTFGRTVACADCHLDHGSNTVHMNKVHDVRVQRDGTFTAVTTQDIWVDHPEKVLGTTALLEFRAQKPGTELRWLLTSQP